MSDADPYFEEFLAERDRRYAERFQAQEKAVQAALTAAKEAVDKAEKAQERRLDLLNEFRSQSQDEQVRFATKEYVEAVAMVVRKLETGLARVQVGAGLIAASIVGVLVKLFTS